MPKRLVDGEKLWRSDKLGQIQPECFRAEYANLLPLALADGSFECDSHKVWALVYAYNRPSVTPATVEEILTEFERVKLLFRWIAKDDKKQWGFWIGIHKDGLLPPESQARRYKMGKTPPQDKLKSFISNGIEEPLDNVQSQSGPYPVGFGIGLPLVSTSIQEDSDMSFKSNIADKAREILGSRITDQDPNWKEMNSCVRVYGREETENAFQDWAESKRGAIVVYPLSEFTKIADGLLRGVTSTKVDSKAESLIQDLVDIANDMRVFFDPQQSLAIARLLSEYSASDVKKVFKEFITARTGEDFLMKRAARDFVNGAGQLLLLQAKRVENALRTAEMVARCTEQERAKAEEEARKALEAEAAEQYLIEDTLG